MAAALAILGAWLVVFGPALVRDGAPFYRDQLLTLLPIREYLHARLLHGELPGWYPYEALGVPFIGQIVTATFHPQTLLFLPFSPVWALKLNTLLAYLLAAMGAYRACRALEVSRTAAVVGAIGFGLAGFALGSSHNLVYLMGYATLPWVFWAALRVVQAGRGRHVAALAVAWALVFLAGDAQSFALCALVVAAAWLMPRAREPVAAAGAGRPWVATGSRLALAGFLASLLICVELLPALALSREAIREVGTSDPLLGRIFSLHPLRLVELAVPNPIPDALRVEVTGPLFRDGGALWATSMFAGVTVLLLAALGAWGGGRRALVLGGLGLVGLLLAMGDRGALLPLVWKAVPVLQKFRFPEKYAGLAWLGLCPLAALGVDQLRQRPRRALSLALGTGAALLGLALLAGRASAVETVFAWRGHTLPSEGTVATAVARAWRTGLLTSGAFAIAFAVVAGLCRARPRLVAVVPLLAVVELGSANARHLPLAPTALLDSPTSFARRVLQGSDGPAPGPRAISESGGRAPRLVTGADLRWARVMRQLLRVDESGRWGIGSIGFNLPATTRRAVRLLGPDASRRAALGPSLNGCYRVMDIGRALSGTDRVLLEDPETRLSLVSTDCSPRAYLARARPSPGGRRTIDAVLASTPLDGVLWDDGPELPGGPGSVRWEAYAPERLRLRVEAEAPSALVVSDELTPGWEATVDGVPAPMFFAQLALRGLAISPGAHLVEMRYRTPLLLPGAAISMLTLAFLVLLSRRDRARARQSDIP